jgi:hypothetical protein
MAKTGPHRRYQAKRRANRRGSPVSGAARLNRGRIAFTRRRGPISGAKRLWPALVVAPSLSRVLQIAERSRAVEYVDAGTVYADWGKKPMICDICGKSGAEVRLMTRSYGKGANLLVI